MTSLPISPMSPSKPSPPLSNARAPDNAAAAQVDKQAASGSASASVGTSPPEKRRPKGGDAIEVRHPVLDLWFPYVVDGAEFEQQYVLPVRNLYQSDVLLAVDDVLVVLPAPTHLAFKDVPDANVRAADEVLRGHFDKLQKGHIIAVGFPSEIDVCDAREVLVTASGTNMLCFRAVCEKKEYAARFIALDSEDWRYHRQCAQ